MSRNIESPSFVQIKEALACPHIQKTARPIGVDLFYSDLESAKERRQLLEKMSHLFDQIPDLNMDVDTALKNNLISSENLSNVYQDLSDFISSDSNHSRLALYLPFQIIPNLNPDNSKNITESQVKFANVYKNAWMQLLFESDIRADFLNGDTLEPGLGEPARVRKAAHLIPEILKKGIIDKEDIDLILEINKSDDELCHSINEGVIAYEKLNKSEKSEETSEIFDLDNLKKELALIDKNYGPNSENISKLSLKEKYDSPNLLDSKISQERAAWIRRTKYGETLNKYAQKIHNFNTIDSLLEADEPVYKILGLKAIFNQNQPTDIFDKLIEEQWLTGNNQIKEAIITGLSYWQKNNLISSHYLDRFGIKIPDLSQPFSVDLDKLILSDLKNMTEAVEGIKNESILSENIYPTILVFGSRVKGYSGLDSDYDIAVFFKPNALIDNRNSILQSIKAIPSLKEVGKICEFWTTENDGKIGLRPISEKVWGMIGPEQIHFLFGGAWIGDKTDINKIQQDLLEKYCDLSRFDHQKDLVRSRLLGNLEYDILQCRLMHKGYRKFYPDKIDPKIKSINAIDGNSAFWDPGFRRVATQLFLSRVFLPDLSGK